MSKHITEAELWNAWAEASAELHLAQQAVETTRAAIAALEQTVNTLQRFMVHDHAPETEREAA
ncbi:hypothetical protein [Arthrobacter sp. UM1]|uniref:hypothetical protein n=1 Tax=Arthrobacter sp. UM1 TaxID=2766776 RepID=UPI001CF68E4B|nr:hypothetical protein [Arthrobacter sp. UM1]MCB4209173.1 hypothetical protein [Arthrobacter sp. UM1]